VSGSFIGAFLPLVFIMMIITGALNPAIDMTAGEKERFTLETLIATPVRPIELIMGKFLAVAALALGNAALNVASFGMTMSVIPMPQGGGAVFQFPWQVLPTTLLLLAPLTLFFAGLLLAVSSLAANVKEAQIYCLPIYLIPVLGLMVIIMPGIELEGPLLLAPVLNTALLIKQLFLGHGTTEQFVFVFASTCLYALATVALAARVFAREDVLFSSQGSFRLFLRRKFYKPALVPRMGDSLLIIALLFPINFHFQGQLGAMMNLDNIDPAAFAMVVLLPQWLLFFGLPILAAWYLKLNLRATFQWRLPSLRAALGAVCLGATSWIVVMQFALWLSLVWPQASSTGVMESAIKSLDKLPGGLAAMIFLLGVTPAICEEHLFRGFFQQGLLKSGKWTALLLVGVIFGAYHAIPLFNQPIWMSMGVLIAFMAWESRSIWPGVIFHFMHNSLSLTGPSIVPIFKSPEEAATTVNLPLQFLLPAVIIFVTGIILVRRAAPVQHVDTRKPGTPSAPSAPLTAAL
jgi:sodium transport system permease protein